MFRAGILFGVIISIFSCNQHHGQEAISSKEDIDSLSIVFQAAFEICAIENELSHYDMQRAFHIALREPEKADSIYEIGLERVKDREQLKADFIEISNFGSNDPYRISQYIPFVLIQYLQTYLPENLFLDHKTEILNICNESVSQYNVYENPLDTNQKFYYSDLTIKVFEEISIDTSDIDFYTFKKANILVESLSGKEMFPCFMQDKSYNCGPACLKSVADYYCIYHSITEIEAFAGTDTSGTTYRQMETAADKMGFEADWVFVDSAWLFNAVELPAIVHWNDNHYVTLYAFRGKSAFFSDPALGYRVLDYPKFCSHWLIEKGDTVEHGRVLPISPK